MPKSVKQVTNRPKSTGSSLRDRIRSVEDVLAGIRISLYGMPKTGKTRLASTFPKPLLIIGSEDGTASVVGTKGIDFVMLKVCSEITEAIELLKEGHYKTAVVDNLTRFRDMRISEILGLASMPVQKGWGFADRSQWGECANSIKELIRPLFEIARNGTLENLVVIAQEQNYGGLDDDLGDSSIIKATVSSALGKSLCDWVNAECDCIGQTLIRMQVRDKLVTIAGKSRTTKERTGETEYCLRVKPDDVYYAGMRVAMGKKLQQEFIVDPSYAKLLKVYQGERVD